MRGQYKLKCAEAVKIPVTFANGFYRTASSLKSGTMFRYLLGNISPAFVYAFSADESGAPAAQIFPLNNTSPILNYAENTVAFPTEREGSADWIQLDSVTGTDYLVVLYSKQALDIAAIMKRYDKERGAFPDRVQKAVGRNFISYKNANYADNEIRFSAEAKNTKAVFGLLLAIDHK
jgi:hypothetical protein